MKKKQERSQTVSVQHCASKLTGSPLGRPTGRLQLAVKVLCCVKRDLGPDASRAAAQLEFTSASTVITATVKNKPQTPANPLCCASICQIHCWRTTLAM